MKSQFKTVYNYTNNNKKNNYLSCHIIKQKIKKDEDICCLKNHNSARDRHNKVARINLFLIFRSSTAT